MLKEFVDSAEKKAKKLSPFFIALDQESKKIRNAAKEFADFLTTNDIKFPEKAILIESLMDVYLYPIDKIDVAIDAIRKNMLVISAQIESTPKVVATAEKEKIAKQMVTFSDKVFGLMKEIDAFVEKAFELSKRYSS